MAGTYFLRDGASESGERYVDVGCRGEEAGKVARYTGVGIGLVGIVVLCRTICAYWETVPLFLLGIGWEDKKVVVVALLYRRILFYLSIELSETYLGPPWHSVLRNQSGKKSWDLDERGS